LEDCGGWNAAGEYWANPDWAHALQRSQFVRVDVRSGSVATETLIGKIATPDIARRRRQERAFLKARDVV
jgi:hypothetical protein